jgi:hypothetical protein
MAGDVEGSHLECCWLDAGSWEWRLAGVWRPPLPCTETLSSSTAVLFSTVRALTWCRLIDTNRFTKLWARNERGEGTRPRSRGVGIKRSWVMHSRRAQWARWAAEGGGEQKGVVRKLTAPLAGGTQVGVGARRLGGREGGVNTLAALVGGSGSQTQLGTEGGAQGQQSD